MATAVAVVGIVLGVAGGVAGARAERKAGKAAKRQGQLQAAIETENAAVALALAERDAEIRRLQGQKLLGAQRAVAGASGITPIGSFQDIAAESARVAEFEARDIEFAGTRRREDFISRATQFAQIGRARAKIGRRAAFATLLSAGARGAIAGTTLISATGPITKTQLGDS